MKKHAIACLTVLAGLWLLPWHGAAAFPPAPFHTVYGDVRDAYGNLVAAEGAVVILYQGSREIQRRSISAATGGNYNYQMRMRIDMFRAATSGYNSSALKSGSTYTLAVNIGGQQFQPIEVATPPTVGAPADRRRLNLTLGIDSDGDGIPDVWEESQLYHGGDTPGPDGWDLSKIDRDGDYDRDGMSNWNEYLAGTYATDRSSALRLEIKELSGGKARLEFYALYGRTYALESSTDAKTWQPLAFTTSDAADSSATAVTSLVATTSGLMSLHIPVTETSNFYRLSVR